MLELFGQLPSPTAQQLYNFLVPAVAVVLLIGVGLKGWSNIRKAFVSREEYDALLKRFDQMQEQISNTDRSRMAKILERVEGVYEEVVRHKRR